MQAVAPPSLAGPPGAGCPREALATFYKYAQAIVRAHEALLLAPNPTRTRTRTLTLSLTLIPKPNPNEALLRAGWSGGPRRRAARAAAALGAQTASAPHPTLTLTLTPLTLTLTLTLTLALTRRPFTASPRAPQPQYARRAGPRPLQVVWWARGPSANPHLTIT